MLGIHARFSQTLLMLVGLLTPSVALTSAANSAPLFYTLEDLGTLGGSRSVGRGINAAGKVVGWASVAGDGAVRAFLYDRTGIHDLGTLGGTESRAFGINDADQVVGDSSPASLDNSHAFLWDRGTMTDLIPSSDTRATSAAYGVNRTGQVAGFFYVPGHTGGHAFIWTGGVITDLGTLGGTDSSGYAIGADGQAVGESVTSLAPHTLAIRAFKGKGSLGDLGTLGGSNSSAYGVNDAGESVGAAQLAGDLTSHACLWGSAGTIDLGTLGGEPSLAFGLNAARQVVGTSQTAGNAGYHAFLWQNGLMTDLNTLIPSGAGWLLVEARAINASGQITGWGSHNGEQRAFRLSPAPRDASPPTTTGSRAPEANGAGWNRGDVTVTLTASDGGDGSGVKEITYSASGAQPMAQTTVRSASAAITISAEGETTITYCATDDVGNVEPPKTFTVRIDKTAPALTFANPSPAPNANGWSTTAVAIPFATTDSGSGIASYSATSPLRFESEGAHQTQSVTVIDQAGNSATFTSPPVSLDTTPPTITPACTPGPNARGWNRSSVTITFACTDALSGLASAPSPVVVVRTSGENQSVSRSATDLAGNTARVTFTGINIDRVKPTLTFGAPFPAPNAAGWNNTNVSFPFTTADDLSGVASVSPAMSPRMLSAQGADVHGTITVTDAAGNVASFTTASVRIDKTKPTVTYTGNAGTYTVDQVVAITCTPADSLSGVAAHTCQDVVGPAYAFNLGSNAFFATATDAAGNVGTGGTKFSVRVTYTSLSALTRQFVEDPVTAAALCDRLDEASAAAASGKSALKKAALDGYVEQVTAQTGQTVTSERAAILARLARAL